MCCTKSEKEAPTYIVPSKAHNWHSNFLKIVSDLTNIYKIGVTTHDISERIDEIEPELQAALGDRISIETIGLWENHGGLERYFIYKYQKYRCQSIKFTEYFDFPSDIALGAIGDLNKLSTRTFRKKERDILDGISSKIETQVELKIEIERHKAVADKKRQQHSSAIKTGMQRAKNWGTHTGRPRGSGDSCEQFLNKPLVIADNATFNKGGKIPELIEAAGYQLQYLPSYSPDLNKIERCWSWLKSQIRKQISQFDCLQDAIESVLSVVS